MAALYRTPVVAPTLVRLPGYPAFLALCFALFGMENYRAVLYVQVAIDLGTCLLIAGFVERVCRKGMIALWLAVLCPFTANYVAMPLTETLSIFCVALGLYALVCAAPAAESEGECWRSPLLPAMRHSCGPMACSWVSCFFLRCTSMARDLPAATRTLRLASFAVLLAALPFVAWTARNWHTFHVLQPLAPRYANDPGEFVPLGYQQWTKTWLVDFASTFEIYWNVPGDEFDVHALPARALQPPDTEITQTLIAQYNDGYHVNSATGRGLPNALAARRIRAYPLRYYLALPLLRLADMWLRPRVEMLNIELRWWQYRLHHAETEIAYAYGALNLLYLLAAVMGLFLLAQICRSDVGLCAAAESFAGNHRGPRATLYAGVLSHRDRVRVGCRWPASARAEYKYYGHEIKRRQDHP